MTTTVLPGTICPTCGIRRDELFANGQRILYGQGVATIVVTPEGRKFVIKSLVKEVADQIIMVAAHVVSNPKIQVDDPVYDAARKLLNAVTDIPTELRLR